MQNPVVRRWLMPVTAPLLLTVYPILYFYASNIHLLDTGDVLKTLAICLAATLIVLAVASIVLRNPNKASVLTSLIVILFYTYGHIHDLLNPSSHRYLLLPWALALVTGTILVVWKGDRLRIPLTYLALVAGVLIVMALAQITGYVVSTLNGTLVMLDTQNLSFRPVVLDEAPDIYYIVLDGYTRTDILRDYYGYDNSPFIQALEERGFYVAPESHSNYVHTFLSLASSLNMNYLIPSSDTTALSSERSGPYQLIQNGAVWQFLDDAGYTLIQFSSGWGATDYNPYADVNHMPGTLNDFQISLMKTTLLKPFYLRTAIDDYRGRILSNFEQLGHVPERPEPTFAFAHFIMPHPPYVFGPNGESTDYDYTLAGNRIWAQTDGYRDQVIFANQRVLALVDQILAWSEPPPIILLQGDHGTASTGGWEGPTEAFLRERTAILNAFYLPDGGIDRLYPTITPVNTFRVVFDTYFGQQLDLLEDRTFFSSDKLPYQFDEIIVGG